MDREGNAERRGKGCTLIFKMLDFHLSGSSSFGACDASRSCSLAEPLKDASSLFLHPFLLAWLWWLWATDWRGRAIGVGQMPPAP
jgi:hypothetical protein